MTDEQVERAKRAPSNFVVLVQFTDGAEDNPETAPPLFKMLSDQHKDSQTARAWLKKNLQELVKVHGEKTVFRIANMQPAVTAEIKVVSKLTIR